MIRQLPLFAAETVPAGVVATTEEVEALLHAGAPVAIGVSGGKDSSAVAFATVEALNRIGHRGPRILIHSDLGIVEWKDSLPTCRRLAEALGLELVVTRRGAGGLMRRWQTRWCNNVRRYVELSCVKLILPWSTATMRFCTSELKTAVICRDLVERFPGQTILSVSGIRREESARRKRAKIAKPQPKLTHKTFDTSGLDWNPILDWSLDDVLASLKERGFPLHEAYTRYGCSRVSCAFCILASRADLRAAATCPDNHAIYREMVRLEIVSSFSFQSDQWLADVAPHLLTAEMLEGIARAKERATLREEVEAEIPEHLLYTKGWPTCVPTWSEAQILCEVRREVARAMEFQVRYTDPAALIGRYEELMAAKEAKPRKRRREAAHV